LAGEIATQKATDAAAFLSRVGCEPFNILANAQLAGDWNPPADARNPYLKIEPEVYAGP
jgi:hypothetical protein